MCGIAGILASEPLDEAATAAVKRMCDAMVHRGPDGEGIWVSPSGHCVLGHRRLIILDPSPSAAQPMTTPDGAWCLTYNGEIYNYRELRSRLEQSGTEFGSSGDTEVALAWLAERGLGGLPEMQGMFGFGLWSERDRCLVLARDPLGIKPLYWANVHAAGRRMLVFASEVRAMLASGLVENRVSEQGLRSYLAYGSVQAPATIIEGIAELPPAHSMRVRVGGEPETTRYWWPDYPRNGAASAALGSLVEPLRDAVSNHLVSDVPLGAFLSGGVDSSAVVAIMAAVAPERVRTLSVVLPDHPEHDESRFARRVAEHCRTDHREVYISDPELPRLVDGALAAMDQPSIDGVNTYLVARAARESGLTVALSGLGGDELFGGYPSFRDVPFAVRSLARLGTVGRRAVGAAMSVAAHAANQSRRIQKLRDLMVTEPTLLGVYRVRRNLFSELQIAKMVGADHLGPNGPEPWDPLGSEIADLSPVDAVSWLEMRTYMANTLLRDSDVMGMANSLEIRVPLLHTPFVLAAQRLGPRARSTSPRKKVLIDAALDALPREIWERPKQGFELPVADWLRGTLKRQVSDVLLSSSLPGARAVWEGFLDSPNRVGWSRPWAIFVLETWRRRLAGSRETRNG